MFILIFIYYLPIVKAAIYNRFSLNVTSICYSFPGPTAMRPKSSTFARPNHLVISCNRTAPIISCVSLYRQTWAKFKLSYGLGDNGKHNFCLRDVSPRAIFQHAQQETKIPKYNPIHRERIFFCFLSNNCLASTQIELIQYLFNKIHDNFLSRRH